MEQGPISYEMPRMGIFILGTYLIVINLICLILLFMLWPGMKEALPQLAVDPPDEIRLLLISTVCGAVGAGIHCLKSFTAFVGNRTLMKSWGWWYVASPVPGMATGLFVYIAIRGGILKTGSGISVDVLNPYAVAAVAVLAGLFSDKILLKLAAYGEQILFKEQTERQKNKV